MRVALLYLLTFLFSLTLPLFGQPARDFLYTKGGNSITITGYRSSERNVTIPATIEGLPVTKIGPQAFFLNYDITSIQFPDTLVSIENAAFFRCARLTSLTFPDSVTTIASDAFYECIGLTSVKFSNSLTSIGSAAFLNCSGLTHLTLPSSLNSIGSSAFSFIDSLKTVTFLGDAPATVYSGVFASTFSDIMIYYLGNKTGFTTPEWIGYPTFPIDFTYTISSGSVTINEYTGPGGAVIIPPTVEGIPVTHIAHEAFRSKETITSISLPDSITSIGSGAFANCTNLASVSLGNGILTIEGAAFDDCRSLTHIIIPASVTSIQDAAFRNTGLSSALFFGNSPTTFGDAVFTGTPSSFSIYYYGSSTGFTSPLWQGYPAVDLVSYNPLHTWRLAHFDTPDNTGSAANTADPDSDGLTNLLEYAFNLNPLARGNTTLNPGRGSRGLPIVTVVPQPDSHPTIRVEYIRRKGTGIRYTPQYSNDLQENSWSTIEGTETVTSINASWERVIIADAPSNPPRHFCRIKVEEVLN